MEIMKQRDVYFFSSTFHESYVPFCEDDGPVNLSGIVPALLASNHLRAV